MKDMFKLVGKKAYINKDGCLFGKSCTINGVIDKETFLIACDWYDSTKLTHMPAKFLTVQYPVNK